MATKKTKKSDLMPETMIAKRLISSYPDSIVTDEDGNLDFEETVYNFAVDVCDSIPESQQEPIFGTIFNDYDEAYEHIINHIHSLRYNLEKYINEDL